MTERSPLMRLNKFLAHHNIGSRRKIDAMILENRITVNGKIVTELGTKVNPHKDVIEVNGKKIEALTAQSCIYLMLHKPKEVISTASDSHGRSIVLDLVKSSERLYPVGRLDQDSTGLILLTNDGELTYRLTHPKFHIPKKYLVEILGKIGEGKVKELAKGVRLEDGWTKPAQVNVVDQNTEKTTLEFILYEGRKRQIRRMCATLHLFVLSLKRIEMGPLKLGDLPEGKSRELTQREVVMLKRSLTHHP